MAATVYFAYSPHWDLAELFDSTAFPAPAPGMQQETLLYTFPSSNTVLELDGLSLSGFTKSDSIRVMQVNNSNRCRPITA